MSEILKSSSNINYWSKTEWYLLIGFLLSCTNSYLCMFYFCSLLIFAVHSDVVNCLKSLLLIIIRSTALNSGIVASVSRSSFVIIKYIIILILIFSIINCAGRSYYNRSNLSQVSLLLIIVFIYISFVAFLNSSYPVVSIMKAGLYCLTFYAVLCGVSATWEEYDWLKFLFLVFSALFVISLFTIPIMSLRVKNGHAFQGIFVHPNTFGIYGTVYITLLLLNLRRNMTANRSFNIAMIIAVLFMQYLSESRTGLFSSLIIIAIACVMNLDKKKLQILLFALGIVVVVAVIMAVMFQDEAEKLMDLAIDFIYKSEGEDILYSRTGQIRRFYEKIHYDMVLGTGFMVPFEEGVRNYQISFDLYVEQGNVFMTMLSETGIVGCVLWLLLYGKVLTMGKWKNELFVFAAPFIISCGEMVFFSTNSVGLSLFFLFALYINDRSMERNDEGE